MSAVVEGPAAGTAAAASAAALTAVTVAAAGGVPILPHGVQAESSDSVRSG